MLNFSSLALFALLSTGFAKDPPPGMGKIGPGAGKPIPPVERVAPHKARSEDETAADEAGDEEGDPARGGSPDGSEEDRGGGGPATADRSAGGSATGDGRQKPKEWSGARKVSIDYVDVPISDLIKTMAELTGRNFILQDEIKGTITIISHKQVTVAEAYEAFLSALEVVGYTTVTIGAGDGVITKIVQTGDASNSPLRVYEGANIPYTDNFVTQIIQLDNVSVSDISNVIKDLLGKQGKVIAYQPTNTLIITDAATNIRRVYRIISQLDVEAPKSKMVVIPIRNAEAADIETILEELFGTEESGDGKDTSSMSARERAAERRRRRRERDSTEEVTTEASATSVGSEGKYIEKIISDERTNSLIILANETALQAVVDVIRELDQNVDPSTRAQIHVVYLEHAKADELATVLANLSENGSSSSSSSSRNSRSSSRTTQNGRSGPGGSPPRPGAPGGKEEESTSASGSATAAFDSGVRITSDENTNSLVIIATQDQFRIIQQVIAQLDRRRKQVFVEAVILELASDDEFEFGVGAHFGQEGTSGEGALNVASAQLGGSSLGLSADLLSGMAVGVFGPTLSVPVDAGDGTTTTLSIPAFGVALNAIQSNSDVEILSTPNILTMDNEEAEIIVGRNIPFPVSTGRDNNGQQIVSYQREDVAIKLRVTPQINESNYVTLDVFQEVTEVEEDSSGLDVTTAGFITSKRSAETTVIVKDNQTVVIGGLIGNTETEVETKIPVLGDLPLIGVLFRGQRHTSRKTNLLIFLTPHVIDEPADLEEVYRIKVAQREEFVRRFYGKSRDEREEELDSLLQYSMNLVDEPSSYRTKAPHVREEASIGEDYTDDVREDPEVIYIGHKPASGSAGGGDE